MSEGGIYIQLGGNLGDWSRVKKRVEEQFRHRDIGILRQSSTYLTEPWGVGVQPQFQNEVWEISFEFSPQILLNQLLESEKALGRNREEEIRWGPRIIDLDILLFRTEKVTSEILEVPHPRMHLRRFVLVPLAEIAGDVLHPTLNKTIDHLLAACEDQGKVELW